MSQLSCPPYQLAEYGENGLCIRFEQASSATLSGYIQQLAARLRVEHSHLQVIPAYQSLTLYQPGICPEQLAAMFTAALAGFAPQAVAAGQLVEIPVCYQPPYAPDLPAVAQHCGLSEQEVIQRHSSAEYLVHMLGFLPGFLYLGGLDESLFCPRKATPALQVPAGAVGIGGEQTGIYPLTSPGGWQIIGQTPLNAFAPESAQPFLAEPLDRIRFVPVSVETFQQISTEPSL